MAAVKMVLWCPVHGNVGHKRPMRVGENTPICPIKVKGRIATLPNPENPTANYEATGYCGLPLHEEKDAMQKWIDGKTNQGNVTINGENVPQIVTHKDLLYSHAPITTEVFADEEDE